MTNKNCILCINTTSRTIKIFGRRSRELKIPEIISKHFWFSVKISNKHHEEICINCWRKTKLFNQFYNYVQEAHLKIPTDNVEANIKPIKSQSQKSDSITEDYSYTQVRIKNENVESNSKSSITGDNDNVPATVEIKIENMEPIVEPLPPENSLNPSATIVYLKNHYGNCEDDFNMFSESYDTEAKDVDVTDTESNQPLEENADADELELEGKIADYFQMNCELCSENLQSMDDVQTHYKSKHNVSRRFLRCCNKKFNMRKRVIDHVRWHIDPNVFKCTVCLKTFNEKKRLTAHIVYHHSADENPKFNCQLCEKRFPKNYMLNQHMYSIHPPSDQIYTCEICQKLYKTKKLLHNHIQTAHIRRNTKHICEICAKVMCSKHTLKEHLKTHYESQPLKCNECGAWLKNQSTLIRHMQIHTDEQQTCDICFKVKPNRNALKNHKRTTHGAAKHKCTFCDKSFRRLVSLKEHVATHTGESLYTCSYCPTTFKSNSNMFKHQKQVHHKQWIARKEKHSRVE